MFVRVFSITPKYPHAPLDPSRGMIDGHAVKVWGNSYLVNIGREIDWVGVKRWQHLVILTASIKDGRPFVKEEVEDAIASHEARLRDILTPEQVARGNRRSHAKAKARGYMPPHYSEFDLSEGRSFPATEVDPPPPYSAD